MIDAESLPRDPASVTPHAMAFGRMGRALRYAVGGSAVGPAINAPYAVAFCDGRSGLVCGGGARPEPSAVRTLVPRSANKAVASLRMCFTLRFAAGSGRCAPCGAAGAALHTCGSKLRCILPPLRTHRSRNHRAHCGVSPVGCSPRCHRPLIPRATSARAATVTLLASPSGPPLHRPLRGLGGRSWCAVRPVRCGGSMACRPP